ncbi:FKBP-type peptidyl-prolyl cis-trans isomerase [Aquiflexum gelatinilyticum]|jgi:FKBP-type peptidyl-prolyl cis-trans isomerase FkpA|uniref:Peptidyl-prolyl cis-trans isomerase n=1 Tax=Aquiflexum gelatinilyticum TaxID=2961943 RepID=A0A9X2SZ93_9BACT|nr:FKBP-type peptidyl-prolyl cis-trans isomerase [Aquiflexum gelatinilyticum]MCR9014178.1 FKBP-type peptidyl-prolyl cis-trans isomerase [Aquiflexum gelatinilyticum]
MKNFRIVLSFLVAVLLVASCGTPSPFGGPVYDSEGNLAIDRVKIDDFLRTAPIDSLYRIHDPTGVVIIVQEEGTGAKPAAGMLVYTNYTGKLLDGTVFDTNLEDVARENDVYDPSRTYRIFQFTLGTSETIQGFNLGFRQMTSGSKGVLIIPSPWAYRDSGTIPGVPANSVLMFEVEFLGMD